jgi:hypothetical protein
MLVGFGRLFLFLLLVCDWAGDPHFGHSPHSRPMSSQDVYCYSISCRNVVRLAVAPPGVNNQAPAASPFDYLMPPPSASSAHHLPPDTLSALRLRSAPTPLRC